MNIKESIQSLLKQLPVGREYADMRYYLLKVIGEAEHIEKKRKHRAISEQAKPHPMIAQQWKFDKDKGVVNPFVERISPTNAKLAIQAIDDMIKTEQQKLDNMKKKPNQPTNNNQDYGGMING